MGVAAGLRPVGDADLAIDVGQVELHRLFGDPQLPGNLAVGGSARHQLEHLQFPVREQRVRAISGADPWKWPGGLCTCSTRPSMVSRINVASATGLAAFDMAPVAPAAKMASSAAGSGDNVSTITAMLSRSCLDLLDQGNGSFNRISLVDQDHLGRALKDLLDRGGSGIDLPEQLELAALSQSDGDRLNDQRVLGDDDESLQRTSFPGQNDLVKARVSSPPMDPPSVFDPRP